MESTPKYTNIILCVRLSVTAKIRLLIPSVKLQHSLQLETFSFCFPAQIVAGYLKHLMLQPQQTAQNLLFHAWLTSSVTQVRVAMDSWQLGARGQTRDQMVAVRVRACLRVCLLGPRWVSYHVSSTQNALPVRRAYQRCAAVAYRWKRVLF